MIPAWLAFIDSLMALALVAAGIVAAHFRLTSPFGGFQMFVLGFLLGIVGLLLGLIGVLMTRKPEKRVARPRAITGIVVGLAVTMPVFIIILSAGRYPAINDITTDIE